MLNISRIGVGGIIIKTMLLGGFLIGCSSCSSRPAPHLKTKEEFIAFFTNAYETGDVKSIDGLVKCNGIAELRRASLTYLTIFAGRAKIVAITCENYDPRFIADRLEKHPNLKFDIQPVYWLTFDAKGDNCQAHSETALGYDSGMLYICGPYEDYKNVQEWQEDIEKDFNAKGLQKVNN